MSDPITLYEKITFEVMVHLVVFIVAKYCIVIGIANSI